MKTFAVNIDLYVDAEDAAAAEQLVAGILSSGGTSALPNRLGVRRVSMGLSREADGDELEDGIFA